VAMVTERRRRSVGPIVALLVVAAVVVVAVVVFAGNNSSHPPKNDVTVQACNADPGGDKPTASGQIVNHTSKASNYVIRLKFLDAQGNQVSEGVSAVKNVERGATASWTLTGIRNAKGPVRCAVTGVSRTHLPGQ
jgi:hypothetical protein